LDVFREIADALLTFADHHIYGALFLLLFLEESGIPLPAPGDTVILLAGAEIDRGRAAMPVVVLLVVLATLLGSSILYWISRMGGMPILLRVSRLLRIRQERVDKAGDWMRRHRGPAIVFGRLTPGLRTVTTIAAGIFEVDYAYFLVYTAISATIWAGIYIFLGVAIHTFYRNVAHYLFRPSVLGLLILAFLIAAATVAFRRWQASRRRDWEQPLNGSLPPFVDPDFRRPL
jgi:membrane protein DedA with SNARE-associated domain